MLCAPSLLSNERKTVVRTSLKNMMKLDFWTNTVDVMVCTTPTNHFGTWIVTDALNNRHSRCKRDSAKMVMTLPSS